MILNWYNLGSRDKVDHDFRQAVQKLKTNNGLTENLQKKYFQEETLDKLLIYHKVDSNLHLKIDKNLIPKKKKVSYFESIKGDSENVGMGPYKLTRYKVYEEPPKPVNVEESMLEESDVTQNQSKLSAVWLNIKTYIVIS